MGSLTINKSILEKSLFAFARNPNYLLVGTLDISTTCSSYVGNLNSISGFISYKILEFLKFTIKKIGVQIRVLQRREVAVSPIDIILQG